MLSHPYVKKEHILGAYDNNKKQLIGFQLSIPIRYKLQNEQTLYTFWICTLLTTRPDFWNKHVAFYTCGENYVRALKAKTDGLISYQSKNIMKVYKNKKHSMVGIDNLDVLFRIIDQKALYKARRIRKSIILRTLVQLFTKPPIVKEKKKQINLRFAKKKDLKQVLKFIEQQESNKYVRRIWDKREVMHYFVNDFIRTIIVYGGNKKNKKDVKNENTPKIIGLASYYATCLNDHPKVRIAVLDNLLVDNIIKDRCLKKDINENIIKLMHKDSKEKGESISVVVSIISRKNTNHKLLRDSGFSKVPFLRYRQYFKNLKKIEFDIRKLKIPFR